MKPFSKTREMGFTLIEILTVIIIIGILAAIAIPVFSAQRSRAQDSQTVSDVRNIVTAAETLLSDRSKSVSDLSQASLEYASAKNVLWDISGNTTTNGYCVAAFNASGKDYKSSTTLLTYDSTAGGLKKVGGSCGAAATAGSTGSNGAVTPTPTTSTAVGSFTATPAVNGVSNLSLTRTTPSATSIGLSWSADSNNTVTGYQVSRSTDGTNYTVVTTTSSRTSTTFTDNAAGNANVYYKVAPVVNGTPAGSTFAVAFAAAETASQTGNVRTFVIPETGTYKIETWGANGGYINSNPTNYGAYVSAKHSLTAGQSISMVIGSQGAGVHYGSGGGGGTFVYIAGAAQPLQVSGGGGGENRYNATSGLPASIDLLSPGSGNAGVSNYAGGGAGWNSDAGGSFGGYSKNNAWSGGNACRGDGYNAIGGFGGGGGGYCSGGGGGGGYTGGNGGNYTQGSGGTSYVSSSATDATSSLSTSYTGTGKIIITKVS